jgi:hypothetical protein
MNLISRVFLSAGFANVLKLVDASERDKALSLLKQIDSSIDASSFLDHGGLQLASSYAQTALGSRRGGPPPNPHNPCESYVGAGDGNHWDCLDRRYKLVSDLVGNMQNVDANGLSIEGGRLILRNTYSAMLADYIDADERTRQAYDNVTNPINGSLKVANDRAKHIFNEETLMVQSINNAWMNLINSTEVASADIERILGTRDNITEQMTQWFNALQIAEEYIMYGNQKKVIDYAWNELKEQADLMTDSETQVWSALKGVEDSMGGSESSTSALADSLVSAADNLDGQLIDFQNSLPEVQSAASDSVTQNINELTDQYNQNSANVLQNIRTASQSKETAARENSLVTIRKQQDTINNATQTLVNNTATSVAGVSSDRNSFISSTEDLFDKAQSQIEAGAKNATDRIQET